jgi:predicted protein tyrosine phosphatase
MPLNLLFVCSYNRMRSCTAEEIFNYEGIYQTRSAGTEDIAIVKIDKDLVTWADKIFVMEQKHADYIQKAFGGHLNDKQIIVLGIPDEYYFMQPALVELLKMKVSQYLPQVKE